MPLANSAPALTPRPAMLPSTHASRLPPCPWPAPPLWSRPGRPLLRIPTGHLLPNPHPEELRFPDFCQLLVRLALLLNSKPEISKWYPQDKDQVRSRPGLHISAAVPADVHPVDRLAGCMTRTAGSRVLRARPQ